MHKVIQLKRPGLPLLLGSGAIVLAFLGLSLAITAVGSARFALALGYHADVGYVVGGVFDIAKALLPVALLALLARRAFFVFAIISVAWIGLVTYSALATHATVSTAIASIERVGAWKMESRSNAQAELAAVEHRLVAMSQSVPRPTPTVLAALNAEKVPAGVWRGSQECQAIRDSRYFQSACARVLELRGELAAAQDYEKLDVRAGDLRRVLAAAPVVTVTDPLPEAFAATLGRLIPFDGRSGVALLLTLVIEIMSCFGFAALRALVQGEGIDQSGEQGARQQEIGEGVPSGMTGLVAGAGLQFHSAVPDPDAPEISISPSEADPMQGVFPPGAQAGTIREPQTTKVLALRRTGLSESAPPIPPQVVPPSSGRGLSLVGSHIPEFARDRLMLTAGMSLGAADLWLAYICWCTARGHVPLTQQRLGLELAGLGLSKWKSCGRIRYRGVQLAA